MNSATSATEMTIDRSSLLNVLALNDRVGELDKVVFKGLESDDPEIAEVAAHKIADFCDIFVVGKETVEFNRVKVGRVPVLWDSLEVLLQKTNLRQPDSNAAWWGCTAVGFVCFGNVDNCFNVSRHIKVKMPPKRHF